MLESSKSLLKSLKLDKSLTLSQALEKQDDTTQRNLTLEASTTINPLELNLDEKHSSLLDSVQFWHTKLSTAI
jgi:hypothetical protein